MSKTIEAYNKLLPTEYEKKYRIFFNELDANAATFVCAELELYYMRKLREMEDSHTEDIKRLNKTLQTAINTLDKINNNFKPICMNTDGDGGDLSERFL